MITLYSGIPGSGKSYKMVADLLANRDAYYIIQNIEGLNLSLFPHIIDFRAYMEEHGLYFNQFFSKQYQEDFTRQVREKYNLDVLVVIDESHEWFDRSFKELKLWLSYHRHLQQTIWLVAHRSSNLSSSYRSFIEVEYRAKSGSMIFIPGYFFYNRLMGGVAAGYKLEKKRQAVFDAYKSQDKKYVKVKKSPMLPLILLVAVLGVLGFLVAPKYIFNHGKKGDTAAVKVSPDKAVAASALPSVVHDIRFPQDDLVRKYRYAGKLNDKPVFESPDGRQMTLGRLPGRFMVIEISGSDFCELYNLESHVQMRITNYGVVSTKPPGDAGEPGGLVDTKEKAGEIHEPVSLVGK